MADGVAPAPTQQASHVSRGPIPPGLVPVAVVLAASVGLLALLPSVAQAAWEVPHILLLGLVISYGVFAQRNADADGGNASKERSLAWNARYHPDSPLVLVADHAAAASDDGGGGQHCARERPLSLPVRRLKSAAARESEAGGDAGDAVFGEEETGDSCASSSGYWASARAVPSPPSVLDADLGLLSPCSQPQQSSRPFSVHSANKSRGFDAATPSALSRVPHDQPWSDDNGEGNDWEEEDAEESDEMTTVSSERSVRGDFAAACAYDHSEGDTSVDEELLELAAKAEPDGEEEVDRKADEFIAKFREQIRLQRL